MPVKLSQKMQILEGSNAIMRKIATRALKIVRPTFFLTIFWYYNMEGEGRGEFLVNLFAYII